LFAAIMAFIALETIYMSTPIAGILGQTMLASRWGWLIALGLFMVVSYVANNWAHSRTSVGTQYLGLSLYVLAQSVIVAPLLYLAYELTGSMEVVYTAGLITAVVFTGLAAIVWFTGANFSFLGPFLGVAFLVAFGLIVCSLIFGFSLGILFVGAMILLACGAILYSTSNVLHEYQVGQHVAASLSLFAAVALLFYYILLFLLSMSRE